MRHETTDRMPPMTPDVFAQLGEGRVAYVREVRSEDLAELVPDAPQVPPGMTLWALIGAGGTPVLIADDRDTAIAGAHENDLIMVALH
jgi:hypothetical protein